MKFRLTAFCLAVLLALPFPAFADEVAAAKDVAPVAAVPPETLSAPDNAMPPARAGPQSDDAAQNPDEELESLVLQLVINNIQMEDFVDGGRKDGRLYLALGELSQLLDFDIKVDPAKKTAEGWFLHPENTLKLSATHAEVKGRGIDLPKNSVVESQGMLLVDAKMLSDWMPLDFSFDDKNMVLTIHSREPLPMQEKAKRQKLHDALEQQKNLSKIPGQAAYKQVDLPYAAVGVPYVDVTAGASYDVKTHSRAENYTVLAAGDFGYLTTRLYASGSPTNGEPLADLRLSAGRQSYESNLLGPLKATYFIGGDINSASLGQVASTSPGRGFIMTNRALSRSDKFDVTNFIGDAKPGWEIELYRNGTLIDFQTVDASGRYKFMDVPILFGTNNFRLAFYGPQGQIEEVTKTINAASSLLEPHQFTYNVSVDQKARSIFGLADSSSTATGLRSINEFEYGVTKYLTVAGGAAHTILTDGSTHNYVTGNLRASAFGVLGSLDNAYDLSNHGHSTQLSLFGDFKGTDLRFQQKFARDFLSEGVSDLTNPIKTQTVIGANREVDFLVFKGLNLGLTLTRNSFASGRKETLTQSQVSYSFLGLSLTNTLTYDRDNTGLNNMNGTFALRGFYHKVLLGGQLTYNLRPLTELNQLNLSATWPFRDNMVSDTQITQAFTGERTTSLQETLTFDMKKYKLSFTGRASTNNDLFAGVSVTTGFGPLPGSKKWLFSSQGVTGAGIVVVRAFMDHNYNQKRDTDEPAVTDAVFRIGGREVKTDKDGVAMLTTLPTNDISTIKMDTSQGKDPFQAGASHEYHVIPREGKPVVLDYPVFEVSQLDGIVKGPDGASVGSLEVDLINTEGQKVGSTHTAFDGYYLIQSIPPGSYKLVISADDLAARNLRQTEVRDLAVDKADFYTRDMELESTGEPTPAPAPADGAAVKTPAVTPAEAAPPAATTPAAAPASPAPAAAITTPAPAPDKSFVPPPAAMPEEKTK